MHHFLISIFVVVLASAAHAEAPSNEAAPYLERGLRFYATQRYADALVELRGGYAVDPHPDFLYAIGQAERMSGNCKHAIDAYRAYLRTQPPELEANRAKTQVERCEAQLLVETAPPKPPAFGIAGVAMASGSVLALGVGTWFLIAGKQHASEADRGRTLEDHDEHMRTARNYRIAGGVALVGGAVLGTFAVLRFLRSEPNETKPAQPAVTASAGGDHIYVGATLSF
jgi:hypothetical protein